jgi:cytosine/uracil/thiamine/allantoin permease
MALRARWSRFAQAFTSFGALHEAIKLKTAASSLSNEDLLPSTPHRRTWNAFDFFAYW